MLGCVGEEVDVVVLLHAGGGDGGGQVRAGGARVVALLKSDCLSVFLIALALLIRQVHNHFPLPCGGQSSLRL